MKVDNMSVEGRPLDDGELIRRAQAGDIAAYEELVVRYQDLALRAAYVVLGQQDLAEDAVQSAFIKAYYALDRFRPGTTFRPWLLTIVAHEARNQGRSASRRRGHELRLAEGRPRDDAAPSPEEAAFDREQREILLRAVNGLKLDDRLVIAYRYFLDLSEAEMAEALGCARGTVKSRLSRALGRLREMLGASAGELQEAVHD
jgi:RNA polymerase sigma-70 factor (ECF subfamily)